MKSLLPQFVFSFFKIRIFGQVRAIFVILLPWELVLSTLSRLRGDFADFADFGPQVGVPDPSFDCKKVSGVVPEQVPGSSGPV